MIQPITKQQETQLVDATMQAIKLANDGSTPDDAIAKVAGDLGYGQPFVERMVEAFNVSKAMKHRKSAQADEKAGNFAVANVEQVMQRLYPTNTETPAEQKSAAWDPEGYSRETRVYLRDKPTDHTFTQPRVNTDEIPSLYNQGFKVAESLRRDVKVAETALRDGREQWRQAVTKLAAYFRHEPQSFNSVGVAAIIKHGDNVKCALEAAYTLANLQERNVKSAAVKQPSPVAVVLTDRIDQLVKDCVAHATRYRIAKEAQVSFDQAFNRRVKQADALLPFFSGLGLGSSGNLWSAAGESVTDETVDPALAGVAQEDLASLPELEAERRGIRARLMLHDLINNDPVLRRADPALVLKFYNDLVQLAPDVARSPLAVRGALRKAVENETFDPTEVQTMLSMQGDMDVRQERLDKTRAERVAEKQRRQDLVSGRLQSELAKSTLSGNLLRNKLTSQEIGRGADQSAKLKADIAATLSQIGAANDPLQRKKLEAEIARISRDMSSADLRDRLTGADVALKSDPSALAGQRAQAATSILEFGKRLTKDPTAAQRPAQVSNLLT